MFVFTLFAYLGRACQAPPSGCLARTWRRNPNYRHGRYCRARQRLEFWQDYWRKKARAYRLAVLGAGPWAPHAAKADWPEVGVSLNGRVYLPRRMWSAARRATRVIRDQLQLGWAWLGGFQRTGRPPNGWAVALTVFLARLATRPAPSGSPLS